MENKTNHYDLLSRPFPKSALSKDTSRGFELTSIKAQYIVERLNESLGLFGWNLTGEYVEKKDGVLYHGKLHIKIGEQEKVVEATGWSKNKKNLGDTFKSANTDAMSKCASKIGVGNEVFKGEAGKAIKTQHCSETAEWPKNLPNITKKPPIKNDVDVAASMRQAEADKKKLIENKNKQAIIDKIVEIATKLANDDKKRFKEVVELTGPSTLMIEKTLKKLVEIHLLVVGIFQRSDDSEDTNPDDAPTCAKDFSFSID